MTINTPMFCLTADLDWASEDCIEDFVELASQFGVRPTVFATHESAALRKHEAEGRIEIGLHPNFLPDSAHGPDWGSVIDHLFSLYPQAKSFRSHCFVDGSPISAEMVRRGLKYDSNLCLYLQPNIVPLNHALGMTRLPVFWKDDTHWERGTPDWNPDHLLNHLLSPGLKILSFHPFDTAVNTQNQQFHASVKARTTTLSRSEMESVRWQGAGTRTFLIQLLELLGRRGQQFFTLDELYRMFPVEQFLADSDDQQGRITRHSDEEYRRYWNLTDTERQEFIRESYQRRNPRDPYATSRDFNLRELEIHGIRQLALRDRGTVIDLGCGNGYTLISMAKHLENWEMIGVDFSSNLIAGAHELLNEHREQMQSTPVFVCADAIEYVKNTNSDSVDYVITERFLLNLPSPTAQQQVVRDIHRILRKHGRLIMCEGSQAGFDSLNDLRTSLGLAAVPATTPENISAIRIEDLEFEEFAVGDVGFTLAGKYGFSDYFVMSRVLHPLLVSPQPPRFGAPINTLARQIQEKLPFDCRYGSNVIWVWEK